MQRRRQPKPGSRGKRSDAGTEELKAVVGIKAPEALLTRLNAFCL